MGSTKTTPISAPLVAALEVMWAGIVKRHPDVPAAVIVVASGTDGHKVSEARWGHFAALRWVQGDASLPEVLVAGEGLALGAEHVLETLLHEAGHGLADVRKIVDTSRQGRYHNRRFQALAEELGLAVKSDGNYGWSLTSLTDATRLQYQHALTRLDLALTLYRRAERPSDTGRSTSSNLLVCTCACPRKIRVAAGTLAAGPITCGICTQEFAGPDE